MAIIYTYPNKSAPAPDDLIVLTDSEDARKTKRAKLSSLKSGLNVVDSITAVLPVVASSSTKDITLSLSGLTGFGIAGQVIKVNSAGDGLEYADEGGSGDTYTLSTDQSGDNVKIKLTSGSGTTDSVIKLVAGDNITLTDEGTTGVKIDSSGGGGKSTIKNQTGPDGTPTTLQGEYNIFNFVNYDPNDLRVFAQADPNNSDQVNIFFPPPDAPTYPPYFNEGAAAVVNNITEYSLIISNPAGSQPGNFKTGGWDDDQVHPAYNIDSFPSTTFVPGSSNQKILGFNATGQTDNPATVQVIVFDADETTELFNATTTALDSNVSQQIGTNNRATITVSNYAQIVDPYGSATQYAANLSIVVNIKDILADNSLEGGRYKTRIIFTPDVSIPKPLLDPLQYPSAITFNDASVFGDDNPTSPDVSNVSFQGTSENSPQFQYLSGVKYYTAGSTFSLGSTGIAGINGDTQGKSASATNNLKFTGLANMNILGIVDKAWSPSTGTVTNFNNQWDKVDIGYAYSNFTILNTDWSYRGAAGGSLLTISDPWTDTDKSHQNNLNLLILRETSSSTTFVEKFETELYRLNLASQSASFSPWSSLTTLSNNAYGTKVNAPNNTDFSQACFISTTSGLNYGSLNGNLIAANEFFLSNGTVQADLTGLTPSGNPDYSGITKPAVFFRSFEGTNVQNVASFTFTFAFGTGSTVTNMNTALINGDVKIYIRKIQESTGGAGATILACGPGTFQVAGSNAFNNGVDGIDSAGSMIRIGDTSTATAINCSVGEFQLSQGVYFEIQYHKAGIKISNIQATFNI
jgi:hypothetical protein